MQTRSNTISPFSSFDPFALATQTHNRVHSIAGILNGQLMHHVPQTTTAKNTFRWCSRRHFWQSFKYYECKRTLNTTKRMRIIASALRFRQKSPARSFRHALTNWTYWIACHVLFDLLWFLQFLTCRRFTAQFFEPACALGLKAVACVSEMRGKQLRRIAQARCFPFPMFRVSWTSLLVALNSELGDLCLFFIISSRSFTATLLFYHAILILSHTASNTEWFAQTTCFSVGWTDCGWEDDTFACIGVCIFLIFVHAWMPYANECLFSCVWKFVVIIDLICCVNVCRQKHWMERLCLPMLSRFETIYCSLRACG